MALFTCHFASEALGLSTSITVILPQPQGQELIEAATTGTQRKYPTLYLLHGWSDDETIWTRRTSIERYVADRNIAVVMPRVDLSYYQDTADGRRYWSYVADELPRLCEQWFPLRTDRESRWAAGLSMGGYGAFRLGLQRPEKFSHVASLSGALDLDAMIELWRDNPLRQSLMRGIFGDPTAIPTCDGNLLQQLAKSPPDSVKFFQWCGTDDFLIDINRNFHSAATAANLDITYSEGPGDHSWQHWDREIKAVLDWLP